MAGPTEKPVGSEAESRARNVAEQTRGEAERIAHEATAAGRDIMDRQRASVASELDTIVKALKKASEALQDEKQDAIADYTRRAADGLARFSGDLRDKDLGTLINRVNDYARRQPGVFLSGALAAGFMLSRFLKSGTGSVSSTYVGGHPGEYPQATSPHITADVEESSLVHSSEPAGTTTSERVS
ncbi:MAG: hypothetical protein WDA11_14190 [Thiohalomonadaceae bacterium]